MLVKPAEGKTYADVLQKIKDAVNPSTTQTVFKTIRCTRGGEVLLELQSTQNKTQFSDEVRKAVGSDATDDNRGNVTTFRKPGYRLTIVDVTIGSEGVVRRIVDWKVLEDFTASDHQYIFHSTVSNRTAE